MGCSGARLSIGIESKVTKVMELSDWTYAAAPVDRKALDSTVYLWIK